MCDQQGEPELYIQHQYMCSECGQLFNTLEEVILHQQEHTGPDAEGAGGSEEEVAGGALGLEEPQLCLAGLGGVLGGLSDSQYQCLECGTLLRAPEELLLHQELHMREGGTALEAGEHELCQVVESSAESAGLSAPPLTAQIQYQCLECLALFDSPEVWLAHRQTHSKAAGHTDTTAQETELVLQTDGSSGPFLSVQNLVLSEQRAGEILTLAQVLATQQQQQPSPSLPPSSSSSSRSFSIPASLPVESSGVPGTATLRLQLCTAQALAEGTSLPSLPSRRACLPPLLPQGPPQPLPAPRVSPILESGGPGDSDRNTRGTVAEHSYQRGELLLLRVPPAGGEGVLRAERGKAERGGVENGGVEGEREGEGEVVIIHPYECSECALLFHTPEDFLHHQGEHFLGQDKESGEGVMETGVSGGGGEGEAIEVEEAGEGEEEVGLLLRDRHSSLLISHRRHQYHHRQTPSPTTALPSRHRSCTAPPATPLQCAECQRSFSSANRLSAHRRVHEQGTHECPECRKVFKKPGSLETHLRTHSGEARHLCLDCGLGFATEMTLIMHRKSHTAEPLHRCQFCAKTFTNMTKFLYHRRTHGNRPPPPGTTVAASPRKPLAHLNHPAVPPWDPETEREREGEREREREKERESEREREAWAAVGAAESACVAEEMKIEMATPGSAPCEMGRDTIAGESDRVREQPETEKGGGEEEEDGRRRRELGPEPGPELASDSMHEDSNSKQDAVPHHGCQHPTAVTTSPRPSSYLDFTCPSCPKRFPSQLRLLRHRRAVHGSERRFRCGVCGKPFKKQVHVRNHLRTHTGERPYQCSDCGKTFSSLANLSRHGLTHSGERPHRCDMCPRAFSQASNLRQHRLLHARPAPFPCPDCPAGFVRPAKLALHRYARHPGAPPPYPCTLCPAGFLRKRLLDQHCEEQHPLRPGEGEVVARGSGDGDVAGAPAQPHPACVSGPASVLVPVCQLSHSTNSLNPDSLETLAASSVAHGDAPSAAPSGQQTGNHPPATATAAEPHPASPSCLPPQLQLHRSSATQSTPLPLASLEVCSARSTTIQAQPMGHRCGECGKLLVSSSGLALHRRTHTGERPFPCGHCGKRFRQSTHLREHLRTHTGERPHACPRCPKRFVQAMHLAEHLRTHTGERPHACPHCPKRFKTFSNLRSHRRTHSRAIAATTVGPAAATHTRAIAATHTPPSHHPRTIAIAITATAATQGQQGEGQEQGHRDGHTEGQDLGQGDTEGRGYMVAQGHTDTEGQGHAGPRVNKLRPHSPQFVSVSVAVRTPSADGSPPLEQSGEGGEGGDSSVKQPLSTVPDQQREPESQPQLIQVQELQEAAPSIVCTELGDTITIIETSEQALPLTQAIEMYHTVLDNGLDTLLQH
ncbi:zinc finger protein 574 [Amia ocellicauda]|uniref:zinc finger protein 574 n=1 Tax=Amia ocellicauda TaxID=2972642 RepID=UPI003464B543